MTSGTTADHVFVTGAGGFIGGETTRLFLERGWRVTALVHHHRGPVLRACADRERLHVVRGDVRDAEGLTDRVRAAAKVAPVQALIHCAGRASDVGRERHFREVNLEPVKPLCSRVADGTVGRLVFVSTTDVYGLRDFRGEAEDELPLVDNRRNPYPRYKIRAEAWVREHLPPDRYAIVRPAAVWGPHDPTLTPRVLGFLRCSPVIVHFGPHRGRNRWPLAHVRNVALALFLAATRAEAAGQAVNVLDDEWTSVDDWYRLLAERFLPGRRFRRVCLPVAAGLALGTPVSALARLLDRSRPLLDPSRYAVYTVSSDLDFSNRRLRDLVRDSGERLLSRDQGLEGLM